MEAPIVVPIEGAVRVEDYFSYLIGVLLKDRNATTVEFVDANQLIEAIAQRVIELLKEQK